MRKLEDLPREQWTHLAARRSIFLDPRWLALVEDTAGAPVAYHWLDGAEGMRVGISTVLATADVSWVLNLPSFLLKMRLDEGEEDALEFARRVPADVLLPSLIAGGRHLGHSQLLYDDEATSVDRAALISAVEDQARNAGASSVAFPYVDEADSGLRDVLEHRGYHKFCVGDYFTIDVDPDGFEGYLSKLPRKRRTSVRHERALIAGSEVEFSVTALRDSPIVELARLEANLMERHGTRWEPETSVRFFESLIDRFDADVFVIVAQAEGAVRGFGLVLSGADGVWYLRQAGFDYAYQKAKNLPLYFEMMYYRMIEMAAEVGVHTIHYGLGSDTAKISRGCTGSPQYCYVLPL